MSPIQGTQRHHSLWAVPNQEQAAHDGPPLPLIQGGTAPWALGRDDAPQGASLDDAASEEQAVCGALLFFQLVLGESKPLWDTFAKIYVILACLAPPILPHPQEPQISLFFPPLFFLTQLKCSSTLCTWYILLTGFSLSETKP